MFIIIFMFCQINIIHSAIDANKNFVDRKSDLSTMELCKCRSEIERAADNEKIENELKKLTDITKWNNFRFEILQKQISELKKSQTLKSNVYEQEGSGTQNMIDDIYILDDAEDVREGFDSIKSSSSTVNAELIDTVAKNSETLNNFTVKLSLINEANGLIKTRIAELKQTNWEMERLFAEHKLHTEKYMKMIDSRIGILRREMNLWNEVMNASKNLHTKIFSALTEQFAEMNTIKTNMNENERRILTLQVDFLNVSQHMRSCSERSLILDGDQFKQINIILDRHEQLLTNSYAKMDEIQKEVSTKADLKSLSILKSRIDQFDNKFKTFSDKADYFGDNIRINKVAIENLESQLPRDCYQLALKGIRPMKEVLIKPSSSLSSSIIGCDQEWTIIQQRINVSTLFNQKFEEYRWPIGKVQQNYWSGNEYIHALTEYNDQMVRFEAWDVFDEYRVAYYTSFSVSNMTNGYRLNISGYDSVKSNLSDAMSFHNSRKFSSIDKDEDSSSKHCARYHKSGWWFSNCAKANLNGFGEFGIIWFDSEKNGWLQLARSRISIRNRNYSYNFQDKIRT